MRILKCLKCKSHFENYQLFMHPSHFCPTEERSAHSAPVGPRTTAPSPSISGAVVYSFSTGEILK